MFLRVESGSGVPISRQIADQIRGQCIVGAIEPGQRLPSVRELARELAVNPNTIHRVYERLEHEGVIESRHGEGTFVATPLPAELQRQPHGPLRQQIASVVDHTLSLGLERPVVHDIVDDVFDTRLRRPKKEGGRTWGDPPSE